MKIEFTDYSEIFLKLSWKWLNDPEIKKLTNTADFTKDEQINWYNDLKYKTDYLIWGLKVDNIPVGACGLKNITKESCEYWGYIGEKSYWGQGIGKQMIKMIEVFAIAKGLKSIWLNVLDNNERAKKLYLAQGYLPLSKNENLVVMKKSL
jgi:RimJ/RimL family protein N-acetyltransferase